MIWKIFLTCSSHLRISFTIYHLLKVSLGVQKWFSFGFPPKLSLAPLFFRVCLRMCRIKGKLLQVTMLHSFHYDPNRPFYTSLAIIKPDTLLIFLHILNSWLSGSLNFKLTLFLSMLTVVLLINHWAG